MFYTFFRVQRHPGGKWSETASWEFGYCQLGISVLSGHVMFLALFWRGGALAHGITDSRPADIPTKLSSKNDTKYIIRISGKLSQTFKNDTKYIIRYETFTHFLPNFQAPGRTSARVPGSRVCGARRTGLPRCLALACVTRVALGRPGAWLQVTLLSQGTTLRALLRVVLQ